MNINRFFASKTKTKEGDIMRQQAMTLTSPNRQRIMEEDSRRKYATELLDTYHGFGYNYMISYINQNVSNNNIRREMSKVCRTLPLLKFFTNSISRVYSTQPTRKFYINDKEIVKKPRKEVKSDGPEQFNKTDNKDKFHYDDKLFESLNNLYNDDINNSIKQAECFTNLLNTTIYKIITDETGKLKMVFLQNDVLQVKTMNDDASMAEQIAFIQDEINLATNLNQTVPVIENWSRDFKTVNNGTNRENEQLENEASKEFEKLFETKINGSGFAPFVVFRNCGSATDFWDQKDNDVVRYIKDLNMSITELRYLERYCSFGLKYTINLDMPADGVLDPMGILDIGIKNNSVPGTESGKNYEIGEFKNEGKIKEVIESIIFNTKMLFSMYNIPLDSLISSNSVRSAENKQMDNDELFATINSQRDIWNNNEQNLFRTLQAVNNRDNSIKIPKGVEMLVDFEEKNSTDKVTDDWLVEIQNNISTYLDWLSDLNPDLDRDELVRMLQSNKELNELQKEEPLNVNNFAQANEQGELVIPKVVDKNVDNLVNQTPDE